MSAAAIEHTYRYAFVSELVERGKGERLQLATSGGRSEFPYFFQGQLKHPRLTAQLLRTLLKVVTSRFHIPAAMLQKILATRDPVVTSGGGLLRFEGFSACCSTYARVDVTPDGYDGVVVDQGTTNVDFNSGMRAALAQIRDDERVGLAVGTDEVTLLRGGEQVVERKVKLPMRWLKGFVEVQAYQSRMEPRAHLGKIETLRFLRSLPRSTMAKTAYWIIPAGNGLRLSQREGENGLRVAGIERLRLLDDLAPLADGLVVYADSRGNATEWQLHFGALRFHLTLTAEVWRGFSGEGQVLADLAMKERDRLLKLVQGMLKWQAEIRPAEFMGNWEASLESLRQAFSTLGSRGLVGYDLGRGAYFHRELPFDLALVEELHPRLKNARKLVENQGVRILRRADELIEAEVLGTDVTHRVRLSEAGDRCTCPWHAKHQGSRGPCKHILAVQIVVEPETTSD
ncbi:MAG TPA: SWIM zinc finger family protein [Clostridia bacterium]|nr:SWIM zinc finger family protein [Clostridia bacterium]